MFWNNLSFTRGSDMKILLVLQFFLCSVFQVFAQDELTGKVISVVDGNTLEVITGSNENYKLVLAGIDSPELTQEFGDKAKKFLDKLLSNKEVEFQIRGKDRWGNYVAVVLIDGDDPRVGLLKEGLAWTAEKNPDPELENHRLTAQEKGKGLWKEENPTPPWIFRRQQTMLQPKSS